MELLKKSQLDRQVAAMLGKKRSEVSGITAAFLREVVRGLAEVGRVQLDGLGTMQVTCRSGKRLELSRQKTRLRPTAGGKLVAVKRKHYVGFQKSNGLTAAIKASRG
jgi:nucleoid DNA-binding protein